MIDILNTATSLYNGILDYLHGFLFPYLRHSPVLFLLLGGGYVLHVMRKRAKYITNLFYKDCFSKGKRAFAWIALTSVFYAQIFLFWSPRIANQLIATIAAVYLFVTIRRTTDLYLTYLSLFIALVFISFPNISGYVITTVQSSLSTLDQREAIALTAAVFAYFGWRESSLRDNHRLESRLRDRLNENEYLREEDAHFSNPEDILEYNAEVSSVRIRDRRNPIYRFLRYFLLTKDHTMARVTLSFDNALSVNHLSMIGGSTLGGYPILWFGKTKPNEYVVYIDSDNISSIENVIQDFFERVCTRASSKEKLDFGNYARPEITYSIPKGLIGRVIIRKELSLLRNLRLTDQVQVRIRRSRTLLRNHKTARRAALTYSFDRHKTHFYRVKYLLLSLPFSWKRIKSKIEKQYAKSEPLRILSKTRINPGSDRLLYEGLYILNDVYNNYDINRTFDGSEINQMPSDCIFLEITNRRSDDNHINPIIPIKKFHPDKFPDLEITNRDQSISGEHTAKYVLRNRGHFYTIYERQNGQYLIAKWIKFNDTISEQDCPVKAELALRPSLTPLNLEGAIWKKDETENGEKSPSERKPPKSPYASD